MSEDFEFGYNSDVEEELPTLEVDISAVCKSVVEAVKSITRQVREKAETEMLPSATPAGGGSNKSSRGSKTDVPYLGIAHVTAEPKRAKVISVNPNKSGFNDVTIKISMGGSNYFHGLKVSNPNYEKLVNAFGNDETKWEGREYDVFLQFNDFYEKNMVDVQPIEKDGKPVATKRGR